MKFLTSVYEPMYEYNSKKYIRIRIPPTLVTRINDTHMKMNHLLTNSNIDNPLEGHILKVKVPFRYRRVMCEVKGKPLQSCVKGDEIQVEIEFKGYWNVGDYSGFSWIIKSSEYS
jgi:hypothetical protein